MARLFWRDDAQWAAVEPYLPKNQPGARRVDDRRIISGIIRVLKTGCRWCDCPVEYGPSTTVYNRLNRWSRRRFWKDLTEALAVTGAVPISSPIDSTYIKAHRLTHGGKGGQGRRRSDLRGVWSDNKGPRAHRHNRPSLRLRTDCRECLGCKGGAATLQQAVRCPKAAGRQRLRRQRNPKRASPKRRNSHQSRTHQQEAQDCL